MYAQCVALISTGTPGFLHVVASRNIYNQLYFILTALMHVA